MAFGRTEKTPDEERGATYERTSPQLRTNGIENQEDKHQVYGACLGGLSLYTMGPTCKRARVEHVLHTTT
jgi:hypothetical protein